MSGVQMSRNLTCCVVVLSLEWCLLTCIMRSLLAALGPGASRVPLTELCPQGFRSL